MDYEKQKITQFLNDDTSRIVHDALLKEFLKPTEFANVNLLAASRIAIDLLNNAWQTLENQRITADAAPKEQVQVGL